MKFKVGSLVAWSLLVGGNQVESCKGPVASKAWYPQFAAKLQKKIHDLEVQGTKNYADFSKNLPDFKHIRALVVPHAAFSYSGDLAATCWSMLKNKNIKRIILLAPSHGMPFKGCALASQEKYLVPGAQVTVDQGFVQALQRSLKMLETDLVYNPAKIEHSIQVQCPFIHYYAPQAQIVPLFVGTLTAQEACKVAGVIKEAINDVFTVVVVSCDFVHEGPVFGCVLSPQECIKQKTDEVVRQIEKKDVNLYFDFIKKEQPTICGKYCLGLLLAMQEKGMFSGAKSFIVGYKSVELKKTESSVSYVGMVWGNTVMEK